MPKLKKKNEIEDLKKSLQAPDKEEEKDDDELPTNINPDDLIPTGSTYLNLACSDNPFGGYMKGRIVNVIGDSDTAKSFCALTTIAAMANEKRFKDYSFFVDDVEEALLINIRKMFGDKTADRIDTKTYHSNTIEQWFANQMKAIQNKKPFIYITDSFDALDSEAAIERSNEVAKQIEKNGESDGKGSYKVEKAKGVRQILRAIKGDIKKTESLSLIISQSQTDLRPMMHGKKTRACGEALKFYCTHEIWLNRMGKLKDKEIEIGSLIQAKLGKNRVTGKKRNAVFPVYYDYGVDDIVSCLNYLIDAKRILTVSKQTISCPDLNFEGLKAALVNKIETERLEKEIQLLMKDEWDKVEESVKLNRKPRWE
jgi:RecA/RadA recombinase